MEFYNHRRLLQEPNITTLPFPSCCFTYPFKCPKNSDECFFCPPPMAQSPSQNQHVPPLVIIMVAVLGTCFLLVSYYAIIVKYCSFYSQRSSETQDDNTHEDFFDENHGLVLDHPIWYINTVGLEQSIIKSIPVFKYKKGDGLVEGTECSVCLGEFYQDESLRLLPKCSHAFHLACIDTWLTSRTNCPLCRAPIVATAIRSSNFNSWEPQVEPQAVESSGSGEGGRGDDVNEDVPSPVVNEDLPSQVRNDLQRVDDEKQIKRMRRSMSMGVSPASLIGRSSSKGRTFEKLAVSMKRSFSSGGMLLLSRSDRSSILPM